MKDSELRLDEKLDLIAQGEQVELTPEEADQLGAFEETALSLEDAQAARTAPNIVMGFDEAEKLDRPTYFTKPVK